MKHKSEIKQREKNKNMTNWIIEEYRKKERGREVERGRKRHWKLQGEKTVDACDKKIRSEIKGKSSINEMSRVFVRKGKE
jgi:hypothetical protein